MRISDWSSDVCSSDLLDVIDEDLALLVFLQPVDAADHGRLAGARRPADDDALAAVDGQVDVLQDMELAVPLVHADDLDRHLVGDAHLPRCSRHPRTPPGTPPRPSFLWSSHCVGCAPPSPN